MAVLFRNSSLGTLINTCLASRQSSYFDHVAKLEAAGTQQYERSSTVEKSDKVLVTWNGEGLASIHPFGLLSSHEVDR